MESSVEKETDQSSSYPSGSQVLAEGSENVAQRPMAAVEEEVVVDDDDDDDEEIAVDTNVEEFRALIEMAWRQTGRCEIQELGSESDQEENQVAEERLESPLVPSLDVDEHFHHLSEIVECPEHDEIQPLLAPRAVRPTSWTSCCGLFDVFKGSNTDDMYRNTTVDRTDNSIDC